MTITTEPVVTTRKVTIQVTRTWVVEVDAETKVFPNGFTTKDWMVTEQIWPQIDEAGGDLTIRPVNDPMTLDQQRLLTLTRQYNERERSSDTAKD